MIKLEIFSTTDVHGEITTGLKNIPNQLSENIFSEKLLIDNGDFFVGSPYATYNAINYEVSGLVKIANDIGYDVMIPGNHDFDYGLSWLQKQIKYLDAEYICANVFDSNDSLIFKPYTIIYRKNIKIAVIGLMNDALLSLLPENILGEIYVKSTETILPQILQELEDDVDLIIVAYHGGLTNNPMNGHIWSYPSKEDNAYSLINNFPEIDVLICGHQHFVNYGINKSLDISVVQPGSHGKYLGYQSLSFNQHKVLTHETATVFPLNSDEFANNDKTYIEWLSIPFPKEDYIAYIKQHYYGDYYLVNYDYQNLKAFKEVNNQPFPLALYQVNHKQVMWKELDDIYQDKKMYSILASPGNLPYELQREGYLVNLFSDFLVDYFGFG